MMVSNISMICGQETEEDVNSFSAVYPILVLMYLHLFYLLPCLQVILLFVSHQKVLFLRKFLFAISVLSELTEIIVHPSKMLLTLQESSGKPHTSFDAAS